MDGTAAENIFAGGGEMGALMRQRSLSTENNWSATPLGPSVSWPSSLKTAVSLCLNSPVAMIIWWGEDLTLLYNDACRSILGDQHPQALGAPGKAIFSAGGLSQSWPTIGPQISSVLQTGKAASSYPPVSALPASAASLYTYSSSPILSESGAVGGVFTVVSEPVGLGHLQATADLQAARGQLETALAAGATYLWRWQIREDLLFVNLAFADLFGVNLERAAAGLPIDTYVKSIHEEDRERVVAAVNQSIETGEDYVMEYRICTPKSEIRWLSARGRADYSADGEAVSFSGALADVTERKQAELEIQKFASLADNSPEFIGMCDLNFAAFYLNEAAKEMIGLDNIEQYSTTPVREFFFPEDQDFIVNEFLPRVLREGKAETEVRFRHFKTGEAVWVIYNVFYIKGTDDQPIGLATASRNITDRKRAEEALRVSEERLRSFVEADLVGILFGDIRGNIYEANDEFLRIVGFTQEEVRLGQLDWVDITPAEYLYLDEIGISEAQATGACTPYEKEYIRKDGSRVPVLLGYILTGERREESVVFVLDLSDRKQTQESLRLSEERYRVLTSTLTSIVWTANAEGEFVTPQPEWEAYTGQNWEAYRSLGWAQALHPDNKTPVLTAWKGQGEPDSLYISEGKIWHAASGEYRYFEARGVPLLNADGSVREWIGNVTDVHDRKCIEAEREQFLQREQAAREAAERANRIKDEFLAVVSHELRSPLNPILGWSQLLKRGRLSAEKTAFALATIERNAQLQVQLIGDLLDISQILRGKMSLEETLVDLSVAIASALETVRLAAESKSIHIEIVSSPCMVVGDAGRLQQVIWNLLSNAVKFTPEGGKITVTLTASDRTAHIRVADTGKGISADFLPYVFEHFRQEDYSTTRQFGGLGLGLAIVRQLTELHGGTVTVESPGEDQGSIFTVHIPLAARSGELPVIPLPFLSDNLNDVHVLVVDDEQDSREITTFALEQARAAVTTVSSGAEALAAIAQSVPHVIVSDIGMPEMDGYSLMRQIRALSAEQGGRVAAVALTAYAGEIDYRQAIDAGFQRHLSKPIDPDDLIKIICELLKAKARDSRAKAADR